MTEFKEHAPGTFCWIDLSTSDRAAAKKFYTELFGWSYRENPAGPDMTYTIATLNGKDVCGLADLMPEQKEQGIPPNWMSYLATADASATVAKAKTLGAQVCVDAFDVMEHGRMAVLMDPVGAMFSVWEAKNHKGVTLRDETNTLCWNELLSGKPDASGAFYTNLFNLGTKLMEMPGRPPYTIFTRGETSIGGMLTITEEMKGVPTHWVPYFAVADCNATLAKATGIGAKIIVPAMDIPNVGRFSVLHDPQGAVFAVIQPPAG